MCSTLSQSSERSIGGSIGSCVRRIFPMFGMLLFLAGSAACHPGETASQPEPSTPTSVGFEWPEDPKHPILILEIESHGMIAIELMPELAPNTVARVIDLAQEGYYDGTTFHRVIPGFMIQGGDPNSRDLDPSNDGSGNPGLRIADEFGSAPFLRGVVGMGNLGRKNSTGGQFFIMHADNRSLNGRYSVIGRVVSGIEVVDAISRVSVDRIGRWGPKDRPIENVLMKRVAILERAPQAHQITTRNESGDEAES